MTSQKKEKYSQILEAAVKVFAEHGFHRSQVSKIAKTAGVADGTIYLYFKRKEDILISLFREKLGEMIAKFHASLETTTGAKDALRNVCQIHFTVLENNPDLAFVTQIELRQSSLELRKEIGKIIKPYIVLIERIIKQGIEEKVFRDDLDVKLTRLLIFGSMDEVVTSWLISGQKYSLVGQLDGTITFFLKGLEP
ncbi:TetR family transcriptional regulator [Paenibacillus alvei]|uniref:TetR family transcriptional regulator n=2 Tax=Paenibacillus TaxID=44249 RepID=A0ABT4GVI3_PAEAL|nr:MULTISPECIES: TetR/AcrR family transcriptional regulator [Paenibacillus]MBG9735934.1 TetR family transcriptional regulator [Paenibacillus alvei]MBG9742529.1 TetR family transcriptional regulator [Paenibacillus alvei]MCY7485638.1 TetR family transcriptional regulator [Paenibacillus alvei]MCY9541355.1 TetR family transcriptional regulator [Paenibacillus alvei]MCY9578213.1 TetR family transcriptional regulator [Paenibacillus alvei]